MIEIVLSYVGRTKVEVRCYSGILYAECLL